MNIQKINWGKKKRFVRSKTTQLKEWIVTKSSIIIKFKLWILASAFQKKS
jgi:hypothetical protein